MASSRDLQRRADQARERLSDRLTQLGDQLSPSAVIGDLLTIDYDKARQDVTQFLSKQVRGNPLAFALIAAGIGWLMISEVGRSSSRLHFGRGSRPRRARRTAKVRRRHARKAAGCFAAARLVLALQKRKSRVRGTDPAALRPRLAMCSASTASTKAPSPNPGTARGSFILCASFFGHSTVSSSSQSMSLASRPRFSIRRCSP